MRMDEVGGYGVRRNPSLKREIASSSFPKNVSIEAYPIITSARTLLGFL